MFKALHTVFVASFSRVNPTQSERGKKTPRTNSAVFALSRIHPSIVGRHPDEHHHRGTHVGRTPRAAEHCWCRRGPAITCESSVVLRIHSIDYPIIQGAAPATTTTFGTVSDGAASAPSTVADDNCNECVLHVLPGIMQSQPLLEEQ